jgi:predicted transcriptional regulator of viral defense system
MPNQMMATPPRGRQQVLQALRSHGGWLRQPEVLDLGVHPRWLSRLVAEGTIERVSKGLYRLPQEPETEYEGFIDAARAVPGGVVCLLSALAHYELTTSNPSEIYLAIPRTTWAPKVDYPPIRFFRFSPRMMAFGVQLVRTSRGSFLIFDREKTICDSLRHRTVVGQDVVIEALRAYLRSPRIRKIDQLIGTARRCRVEKRIRPYLEALA